jgi:hypothetical protein
MSARSTVVLDGVHRHPASTSPPTETTSGRRLGACLGRRRWRLTSTLRSTQAETSRRPPTPALTQTRARRSTRRRPPTRGAVAALTGALSSAELPLGRARIALPSELQPPPVAACRVDSTLHRSRLRSTRQPRVVVAPEVLGRLPRPASPPPRREFDRQAARQVASAWNGPKAASGFRPPQPIRADVRSPPRKRWRCRLHRGSRPPPTGRRRGDERSRR